MFVVKLNVHGPLSPIDLHGLKSPNFQFDSTGNIVYDTELDSALSVLWDICNALSCTENVEFVIFGLGDDHWPVNMEDLAGFIEQLPAVIAGIKSDAIEFSLRFPSQHLQRFLNARREDRDIILTIDAWYPMIHSETVEAGQFLKMLEDLMMTFVTSAESVCPQLTKERLFRAWIGEI